MYHSPITAISKFNLINMPKPEKSTNTTFATICSKEHC